MTVNHDRWADSAGAYVLGAMAPDERAQFETHLATCPACREEVDDLRPAAEALPMASPPVLPPRALKDRIMAEVEREADLLASAGPAADRATAPQPRSRPRRRGLSWLSGWRLAPVAAVLIVAAVLAISSLTGGTTTYTAQVQASGASAELEVSDDRATLVGTHLPAPPEGKVYEVWLMPKGSTTPEPTSVLFKPNADGSVEAKIPGSMADVQQVLVTAEPPSGSAKPTSNPVLSATLT
jgi:anti-sigma-K factor RskA